MSSYIPCQWCKTEFPKRWNWFICNQCGYRICHSCISKHQGKYSQGGFKCSQCSLGQLKMKIL